MKISDTWDTEPNRWVTVSDMQGEEYAVKDNEDIIIMQYTGLKDSNDKEIYEGDILKHPSGEKGIVKFSNGCFIIDYGNEDYSSLFLQIGDKGQAKIVGNIYENKN